MKRIFLLHPLVL